MSKSGRRERGAKRAGSRADVRTSAGNFTAPINDSYDQFGPWLYLNNYKASYFLM